MAVAWGVAADGLRGLLNARCRDESDPVRWAEESAVRPQLRGWSHAACRAVDALAAGTVRPVRWWRTSTVGYGRTSAAPSSRGRLFGPATVLPEPPRAGAERTAGAAGPDAGGTADRCGARALAGTAGIPSLCPPRVIRRLIAVARHWLAQARRSSGRDCGRVKLLPWKGGF